MSGPTNGNPAQPNQQPWYQSFFGRDYLDVYDGSFTEERARQEVSMVEAALALQKGESVMDLCCGQGRHAVELARRGYAVTGLDLSAEYLRLTEAAAASVGVRLETVEADMRAIPAEGRFDALINMYSSFGYLESEADDAMVLTAIGRALRPGGRALLDLLNREWVVHNNGATDWHYGPDGTLYLEARELDLAASRNHVTFTAVSPSGERRDLDGHHIRLYTLREMIGALDAAGLRYETVYGGYNSEPYSPDTRRMVVIASKPR
jgi:SAM-dependent methyltransferase